MTEIQFSVKLWTLECANCCVTFGVPHRMIDDRRKDGKDFYCPNGHVNNYGRGENARLREERDAALRREIMEQDQRHAAERERDKLKRRIKEGVCPCCKRTFCNLQRHIATKHPEFAKK